MSELKFKLSLVFLLILGLTRLQAQESVNATGSNVSSSGGSVSYSVGQVVYNYQEGTYGSVTQGVQHYAISIATELEQGKTISLTMKAYPNPTTDRLTLSMADIEIVNLSYQMYDTKGQCLLNKDIVDKQTIITMNHLVPSVYFVKIMQDNKEIKSFKVIKQ